MLCETCKRNPASVHTVEITNGVKQEHYLCANCAKGAQFSLPTLMGMLSGMQAQQERQQRPVCECGYTLSAFQKTGLLGCPKCYKTFEDALLPVIKRAQGGRLRHVGRSLADAGCAAPAPEQAPAAQDECARLREELQQAIAGEHYERAAELRDRLRALEGGKLA